MAVGGSRQHILNSPSYSASEMFCFDRAESIAGYQPVLLMRKDFPFRNRIDEIIGNAFESGLFNKWIRDSQRKKQQTVPFEPKPALTLVQFAVFFTFIYCLGCIMSTLSFCSEILTQRMMKQRNVHRIWIYFERLFDGERHYLRNLPDRLMQTNDKKHKRAGRK